MILSGLDKYRDVGLLILRVGIGILFINHGAPKLFGGPETWTRVGGAMSNFGITVFPAFWGFMAAFSEFFGGIFLILGFLVRPFCSLLTITMIVAVTHHLARGDGIRGASHALKSGILFFSLLFIGPGRYSLDQYLSDRRSKNRPAEFQS